MAGEGPAVPSANARLGFDSFVLSLFFLHLGDGSLQTEIPSQRAVFPKITNKPCQTKILSQNLTGTTIEKSRLERPDV